MTGIKWLTILGASVVALFLAGSTLIAAQQQMGERMPMGGPSSQTEQPMGHPPRMEPGTMGQGMMEMPMMGMMCPMMGRGRMGMGGMMGMMGGGQADPKAMGRMLQVRGDILRAIGEVLIKHGKAMEGAK